MSELAGVPAVPTPDGRRRDTRARLVRAGVSLFRRKGPAGTGLAEVCARAGTTKGVLAHHLPGGKAELVAAAVEQNAAEVDALLARLLDERGPVAEALRTFFDGYADLLDADPDLGCPVAAAVVDGPAVGARAQEAAATAFSGWTGRLASALEAEGRPSAAARHAATTVVAAMEGAILLARAQRDPDLLRRTGAWLAAHLVA